MRTVCIEPAVVAVVVAHAERRGETMEAILRMFLDAGLAQVEFGSPLTGLEEQPTAVRHLPCSPSLDEDVRQQSLARGIPEDQMVARLVRLGMVSLQGLVSRWQ